jgi:GDP-L-fucose synthase
LLRHQLNANIFRSFLFAPGYTTLQESLETAFIKLWRSSSDQDGYIDLGSMGANPEKVYIAGHAGLVGSAIVREIEKVGKSSWIGATRTEFDLCDRNAVFDFMQTNKPDAVIIAAAKVGGIVANSKFPVEFLSENVQVQTNLMDAAHQFNVESLVFLGSSCIYPKFAPQPISEDSLLTGPLEETNEAYAIAKIAGVKLVQAYRKEFGRKWSSAMPTNLYGPEDNFDLQTSHVLPALMRKFHEAKVNHVESVTLWGSGSPKREFLHVDDLAKAILFLLEGYDDTVAINVGTGIDLEIRELANLIAQVTGYNGEIEWDTSKPDGTPRKLLDVTRINSLGWKSSIELIDGIQSTYEWFLKAVSKGELR